MVFYSRHCFVGILLLVSGIVTAQILPNAGHKVRGLPQDLKKLSANLQQLTDVPSFHNMLKRVRGRMGNAISMPELLRGYNKLLTNRDFLQDTKDLLAYHDNNPSHRGFPAAMEQNVKAYLQRARRARPARAPADETPTAMAQAPFEAAYQSLQSPMARSSFDEALRPLPPAADHAPFEETHRVLPSAMAQAPADGED